MIISAQIFVWAFFLLIVDQTLVIMAFKFGSPIKPTYAYFVISSGLLISGLLYAKSFKPLLTERWFFALLLAIVTLGAATYRGESPGPDFGAILLRPAFTPSAKSYVIWPALNLLSCAGLYLLARNDKLRRTIVYAAFAALVLQLLAMEADMWWYAVFGDPNGRAGGLAQNANVAALLVVVLAALTLSTRLAPYAVTLALAGSLLSQSKTGLIAAVLLSLFFIFTGRRSLSRNFSLFAVAIVAGLAATVYFSPVLNPSPEEISARLKTAETADYVLPPATLDHPVSPEERLRSRTSVDESAGLRMGALKFFWMAIEENPMGYGTGFTNKFLIGPHNTFLKLAVDSGFISAVLLLALLGVVSWGAFATRSPQLIALTASMWLAALFYHTLVVDPIVLPAIAVALGVARDPPLTECRIR